MGSMDEGPDQTEVRTEPRVIIHCFSLNILTLDWFLSNRVIWGRKVCLALPAPRAMDYKELK